MDLLVHEVDFDGRNQPPQPPRLQLQRNVMRGGEARPREVDGGVARIARDPLDIGDLPVPVCVTCGDCEPRPELRSPKDGRESQHFVNYPETRNVYIGPGFQDPCHAWNRPRVTPDDKLRPADEARARGRREGAISPG